MSEQEMGRLRYVVGQLSLSVSIAFGAIFGWLAYGVATDKLGLENWMAWAAASAVFVAVYLAVMMELDLDR